MTTTVYKQLATMQDLATGNGKVTQRRNGIDIELDKINMVVYLATIADLRAITYTPVDDAEVSVLGYHTAGDGGGGQFYWDASSIETDNNGTIIKITSITTGRWIRSYNGMVDVRYFGAKDDDTYDSTTHIQAAITFSRGDGTTNDSPIVKFPAGRFLITDQIDIGPGTKIEGDSIDSGGFVAATSFPDALSDSRGTVILFRPTSEKSLFVPTLPKGGSSAWSGIGIKQLNIWGNTSPDEYHRLLLGLPTAVTTSLYAFDFDEVQYSQLEDISIFGFQSGIRFKARSQRNIFTRVQIGYCRYSAVLYDDFTTAAIPTSDIWDNCTFRTCESAFEQKAALAAPSGVSLNIRLDNCLIEDMSSYGFLLPLGVSSWVVSNLYVENVGIDTSFADRSVFNIGGYGPAAAQYSNQMSIIASQFVGSNTNSFLIADTVNTINITNCDVKNFGTLITATANTRDYGINIFGLTHYSTSTFYSGPNNKLFGLYRSTGLDSGSNTMQNIAPSFGSSQTPITYLFGQQIRIGDSSTSTVSPGSNATIDLGISGVLEWDNLYIVNTPVGSSDERKKQQIVELNVAEKAVATKLKTAIKIFKFNSEVDKVGEEAKKHVGIIAQEVVAIFKSEGLDAHDYGIISYVNDSYGVRYSELWGFIISSM